MGSKHVLTVPGRYEQIKDICQFVAVGAEQAGMDEAAIFHVELACDEACTNIIEHAYGAEDTGKIVVSWQIEGNAFMITIQDNGRAFNPKEIPPPLDITSSDPNILDRLKEGGLGIHFMNKLMDEVHFTFDREKGNTLIMVKKISKG